MMPLNLTDSESEHLDNSYSFLFRCIGHTPYKNDLHKRAYVIIIIVASLGEGGINEVNHFNLCHWWCNIKARSCLLIDQEIAIQWYINCQKFK